ncbi:hypothetical protein GCM10027413_22210 [Conyzicola nivalis]|uniref:LPXTG cell wall anchor domain-containing protein n=1 Tax=Conyzicola nivalis TaxID=1477021 RepID=A0A916SCP7_9MICO|nr:hypothetical protein [Conyzicola nivalis]GGA92968.1 hypothetical protein GCM10010979_04410 [Conyzicola nivalis]
MNKHTMGARRGTALQDGPMSEGRPDTTGIRATRIRATLILLAIALVASVLAIAPIGVVGSASAAVTINQCNSVYNAAAAQVECQVTIVNTVDVTTGVGSSTVTVGECIGAPAATVCGPVVVTSYNEITTTVDQCNGSGNAGGGVVICAVQLINEITGAATITPATVNQCAGSGTGGGDSTLNCDRYDTTTGATITQCNGSVNGGGAPTRVNCAVGPSTETALIPISVNQCNGSANGGGALMFCSVQLINRGANVTYVGPPLGTPVPIQVPGVGGIVPAPDVVPAAPVPPTGAAPVVAPVAAPVVAPGTPLVRAAAAEELAATGVDPQLPAMIALLALATGATLSLVAIRRRRQHTV